MVYIHIWSLEVSWSGNFGLSKKKYYTFYFFIFKKINFDPLTVYYQFFLALMCVTSQILDQNYYFKIL